MNLRWEQRYLLDRLLYQPSFELVLSNMHLGLSRRAFINLTENT